MHTHTHSYIEALTNNCLSDMLNDQKCSDTPALEIRCDAFPRKLGILKSCKEYNKEVEKPVIGGW